MTTINPHLLQPSWIRQSSTKLASGAYYRPVLMRLGGTLACKRICKTAGGAMLYARRIHERWVRLYDAAMKVQA